MAGSIRIRAEGEAVVVASYNGTGATLYLDLGFVPVAARAINATDGDAGWSWIYGMDAGMCISEGASLASVTSQGVTALDGSAGNGIGLQLGTNSIVNETGSTYFVTFER